MNEGMAVIFGIPPPIRLYRLYNEVSIRLRSVGFKADDSIAQKATLALDFGIITRDAGRIEGAEE